MKKFLILFFIFFSILGYAIDIKVLEEVIKSNPNDIKNRILLARIYIDNGRLEEAEKLINEVERIEPKVKELKELKDKLLKEKEYYQFLKKTKLNMNNISNVINTFFKKQKYKDFIYIYRFIIHQKPVLKDSSFIKVAKALSWSNYLKEAKNIMSYVKKQDNKQYLITLLNICNWSADVNCSFNTAKKLVKLYKSSYTYELLIKTYLLYGDYEQADMLLLMAKRKYPRYKKYKNLGYQLKKKREDFIKTLKEKYEKKPNYENLEILAYQLFSAGKKDETINVIKKHLEKNPSDPKVMELLARYLTWFGRLEDAIIYYEKVVKLTNLIDIEIELARVLGWNGEYQRSENILKKLLKRVGLSDKYKNDIHKLLGYIRMWQQSKEEAIEEFKKALSYNKKDEEAQEQILILQGKYKKVLDKYHKLIKTSPKPKYYYRLGEVYEMKKDYIKAIKYYEKYLKFKPGDFSVIPSLGELYVMKKNYQKGFSLLEYYAYKINTIKAKLRLAKNYYWAGLYKSSLSVVEEILNEEPNNKDALELKSKILKSQPRVFLYEMPQQSMVPQLNLPRASWDKLKIIARRLRDGGFKEEAVRYYEKHLLFEPENIESLYEVALLLEELQNYKKAAAKWYLMHWYRKDAEVRYHYAYCLEMIGQKEKARNIYKEIISNSVPKKIINFIEEWRKVWESRNFYNYSKFYQKSFLLNKTWVKKHKRIFLKNKFIRVKITNLILVAKNNNSFTVKFNQEYASTNYNSKGIKTLVIKCNKQACKIIKEKWEKGWLTTKNDIYIEKAKERLKILKTEKKPKKKIQQKELSLKQTKINVKEPVKKKTKERLKIDKKTILKTIKQKNKEKNFLKKVSSLKKKNSFIIKGSFFEDKDKLRYKNISISGKFNILPLFEINIIPFYHNFYKKGEKIEGKSILIIGKHLDTGIKLGIIGDFFNKFNNINPYLGYEGMFNTFSIKTALYKRNIGFERYSICAFNNSHQAFIWDISGYKYFSENKGFWFDIKTYWIDDGNFSVNPQFDLEIGKLDIGFLHLYPHLKGWYLFDTEETKCYYSPDFYDSTEVGFFFTFKYWFIKTYARSIYWLLCNRKDFNKRHCFQDKMEAYIF